MDNQRKSHSLWRRNSSKHRLTSYHDFFVERIKDGETVLDVGCGIGVVSISLAQARRKSKILGIDINKNNIDFAKNFQKKKQLKILILFVEILIFKKYQS